MLLKRGNILKKPILLHFRRTNFNSQKGQLSSTLNIDSVFYCKYISQHLIQLIKSLNLR